jgi:hypothetical protein
MSDTIWNRLSWAPHVLWFKRICPHCTSVQFKQAELRPYDGILRLFALRPVRCMFCWRRFYWVSFREVPVA